MEWRLVDIDYSNPKNWEGRRIIPRKHHDKKFNNKLQKFKDNLPDNYKKLIKIYGGFPISCNPIKELRDIFVLHYPLIGLVEYVNDSYIIIKEHKNYDIKNKKSVIITIESIESDKEGDIKYINFSLV